MKKFERPEIIISLFMSEDIVTASGQSGITAKSAANDWLTKNKGVDAQNIFVF